MCAINGIVDVRGRSVEERVRDDELVRKMDEKTRHRGPDGTGAWSDAFATLGHNRLAVIDLSVLAAQPMMSASGRYVIVFNGEIYNFKELRRELARPFATQGDTEVILAAYEAWGAAAFAKLRGMFACALWDTHTRELLLVRDQSGIKPLYYTQTPERVFFSSEIAGLLAAGVEPVIAHEALLAYVRQRYVPEPLSLIAHVRQLPPGHLLRVRGAHRTLEPYAHLPLAPLYKDPPAEAAREIRKRVDAAVVSELVSDRPVGVFLSGGLDSTIVLDAAARAGSSLNTFTIRFGLSAEEQADKFNADADLAAQSAAAYGTSHTEVLLHEEDFVELLPSACARMSDPVGNATAVAQLYLAREARKKIVVALLGEGGDELFGGYPRYRLSRLMDQYQRLPGGLRRALSLIPELHKLDTPPGIERIERFMFEKDDSLARAVAPEYISDMPALAFAGRYLRGRGEADFAQLFMDADRRSWLVDEALARTDAMTMTSGLEARVPLLNWDVVSYASRLPSSMRRQKALLRAAYEDRLPPHIRGAEKRGFFSPIAKWLRRPRMHALAREVLSPGYHAQTDALLAPQLGKLLEDHISGKRYSAPILFSLIVFRLWARAHAARL